FPDNEATLEAARVLVAEGFSVLPYVNDDLIMAKKLRDAGCAAVMPLAAPIGSGLGIQNAANLRLILDEITDLPVIVDAGVGTASDAALAMEMGGDGVLMNTASAGAQAPVRLACAQGVRDASRRGGGADGLRGGAHSAQALRDGVEPLGGSRPVAVEGPKAPKKGPQGHFGPSPGTARAPGSRGSAHRANRRRRL